MQGSPCSLTQLAIEMANEVNMPVRVTVLTISSYVIVSDV